MGEFEGFPERMRYTPVPNVFFSSLLPQIDDLAELKVTLYLFRVLSERRGFPRIARLSELAADRTLLVALQQPDDDTCQQRLMAVLDRACDRGTLLSVKVGVLEPQERCYFLNTPANLQFVKRVMRGEATLAEGAAFPTGWTALPAHRQGIYNLYEQNIGLITPLLAEELQQAEEAYPAEWIEAAFREAVAYNRRNWRYVRRILENWATDGREEDGKPRRRTAGAQSPTKYLEGKYGHLLKR